MSQNQLKSLVPMKPHVEITSKSFNVYHHNVFLDENIVEPSEYRELIQLLLQSTELDTVEMIINNSGGYLHTARAVIESIKTADCHVRAVLIGECHSAASMIALSCKEITVLDSAQMMIHQASWGVVGAGNNNKTQNDFIYNHTCKLVKEIYSGFMTPKEIDSVLSGTEFWLEAAEIRERVERMNKFKAKQKKA